MANVLNRTTKVYLTSVHEPDYPQQDWIWNPNLSAVAGWPNRYWTITGDVVSLMDAAARATVDAQILSTSRDSLVQQLSATEDLVRGLMLALLDELNAHASKINELLTAIDGASAFSSLKTRVAAVADYPPRTADQIRTSVRNKLGV